MENSPIKILPRLMKAILAVVPAVLGRPDPVCRKITSAQLKDDNIKRNIIEKMQKQTK
jgi:hypothetical protein